MLVKGTNNSIFHQRGQPRFSSGSEEDIIGGKISHKTGDKDEEGNDEGRDSLGLGAHANMKPTRNIRISPGMRGSLPRMSIDGENYSKRPKYVKLIFNI